MLSSRNSRRQSSQHSLPLLPAAAQLCAAATLLHVQHQPLCKPAAPVTSAQPCITHRQHPSARCIRLHGALHYMVPAPTRNFPLSNTSHRPPPTAHHPPPTCCTRCCSCCASCSGDRSLCLSQKPSPAPSRRRVVSFQRSARACGSDSAVQLAVLCYGELMSPGVCAVQRMRVRLVAAYGVY